MQNTARTVTPRKYVINNKSFSMFGFKIIALYRTVLIHIM